MGSHRARHRADQNQSEELATDLLARLADETRPRPARTRHTPPRPALDPFSTAPFPAHLPQTAEIGAHPTTTAESGAHPAHTAASGAHPAQTTGFGAQTTGFGAHPAEFGTHPAEAGAHPSHTAELGARPPNTAEPGAHPAEFGTHPAEPGAHPSHTAAESGAHPAGAAMFQPRGAADPPLGAESGPVTAPPDNGGEPGGSIPAQRFPTDPRAPFPVEEAPKDLADAPRAGRARIATLRRYPIYAAVSATVITATAAVAASTGPAAVTPPTPPPDRATSPALAAAALALAPAQKPAPQPAPVVPKVAGGAAMLAPVPTASGDSAAPTTSAAPGEAAAPTTSAAPGDSPILGSTIAAQAAADAKAYAAAQARKAADRATVAPNTAPKTTPKTTPRAVAAPTVTGNGTAARALGLAKGKLGTPYGWGAAGPSAFDCSGLIVWAYKQLGISLPHSSATLSTMGTPVAKAALQPGDLVFFYSPVSHVGIYAGNGMVLNATQSGEPVQFTQLANLPFHNATRITM